MTQHHSKTYHLICSWLFAVILIAPLLIMVLGLEDDIINNENRQFDQPPEIQINQPVATLTNYRTYFNESFGGKSTLVNTYINIKRGVLNETPMPNSVVEGEENWFFLGNYYNNVLRNAFGNYPMEPHDMQTIANNLKDNSSYLKSKNIKFYVVIPPDKHHIYNDKLPFQLKKRPTRLETLKSYVEAQLNFNIIDLSDVLERKKAERLVYVPSDSHWNEYGAFLGYEKFMSVYINDFPETAIETIEDYDIEELWTNDESVNARMINLNPTVPVINLNKKNSSSVIRDPKSTNNFLHFTNPTKKGTIIMHRDSFSNAWIKFFNETFGETYFLRGYTLNKALIDEVQPDAVIFELVERNIDVLSRD